MADRPASAALSESKWGAFAARFARASTAKRALVASSLAIAAALVTANVVAEQDPNGELILAKVGARNVTARMFLQRIRALPDFQLATFGSSPSEIKRRFLEEVVVRDELLAQGAETKNLERLTRARERIDHALRNARIAELKDSLAVTPAEIAAFYQENRERFDSAERIAITRILCASREEAATVLAEARKAGTAQRWNDLAREHSTDKATAMRGGALGFIAQDGSSSEASVRVDPALFVAARKVKDGEFVPEPVEEGGGFAVIWRRGSTPAVHRTLDEESEGIRQVLVRRKLGDAVKALTTTLRSAEKIEEHPELIDLVEVNQDGNVSQRKRPGVAKRRPSESPVPSMTPTGLR
jgi:peptidyl-prolyl cis-trans isomerase C